MAFFFSSHKYAKIPTNDAYDSNSNSNSNSNSTSPYEAKTGYQYTNAPFANATRSNRSDSSGSYSSVASSDSAYEKLAPSEDDLAFAYDGANYDGAEPSKSRRVRFQLEKDLPALPRETSSKKPRRMSSRDGAYAWFAQRRYQSGDERLEDSMEKRTF